MKKSNLIFLNIEKAKRIPTTRETRVATLARIVLGLLLMTFCFYFAYLNEKIRTAERREKFEQCVRTGKKPIQCSFEIAFTENY